MIIENFDKDSKENCTFCGERKADAAWLASEDQVYCCKYCATMYLPQLMADAIVGGTTLASIEKSTGATIEVSHEDKILKRFHSAFSSALIQKLRISKTDQ